jgi:predicted dehydrogenase
MTGRLRFAIAGLDHWYTAMPFAQSLFASDDADLVLVADERPERTAQLAGFGTTGTTGSLEAVLADDSIEVVVTCLDAARNPDFCVRAAQAGKHLVSVKPMAMTLADADRVVAAVESAGIVFVAAESRTRVTPLGRLVRELGTSRRLGPVLSGSLSLAGNLPASWPGIDDPGWWADPSRTPGGGFIDHALYHVDRMRWMLRADVASVTGRAARLAHPGLAVEDYGHAIFEFTDGSVVAIEDGWAAAPGAARTALALAGSEGAIAFDSLSGSLSLFDGTGWTRSEIPDDDPSDLAPLLEHLRSPTGEFGTVRDAWDNLAACLAFYESAATGTAVTPARGAW